MSSIQTTRGFEVEKIMFDEVRYCSTLVCIQEELEVLRIRRNKLQYKSKL